VTVVSASMHRAVGVSHGEDGPDPRSAAIFESLEAAFADAARMHGDDVHESSYTFAGRWVRMRIVGRGLAERLAGPFLHLRSEPDPSANAELSIELWDECETGVPCPVPNTKGDLRATWAVANGFLTASPDGRFVRFQRLQSLTCLDRKAAKIVGWRACGGRLPVQERTKPIQSLLSIWSSDRDVPVVHAGLVSRHGQGVLVAGPSGSGKSTVTLACLDAGWDYLGDDLTGLQERDRGAWVGHSFYATARVHPDQLTRFPRLVDSAISTDDPLDDKCLVPLSVSFPRQLERAAEIRALALPRVVATEHTTVRPASRGETLRRIAPSSLLTLLSPGARGLERLARLVRQVPSYWLEVGRDVGDVPRGVEAILLEAGAS
jgi:hypothetical protein